MKTATLPSIRVEPELREKAEAVLRDGETLSAFMEESVRDAIQRRTIRKEFIAAALAAEIEAEAAGTYYSAEEVLDELEDIVSRAEAKAGVRSAS